MELYNELYNAIDQRHTVRDIEDRKVPEEILEKVIVSVFKAPTNDHMRDWHFIIIPQAENSARNRGGADGY